MRSEFAFVGKISFLGEELQEDEARGEGWGGAENGSLRPLDFVSSVSG